MSFVFLHHMFLHYFNYYICSFSSIQSTGQKSGSNVAVSSSNSINLTTVVNNFYADYQKNTPRKLKMIDAYLLYILITGVVQFAYCCLVGTFPFNSFLSGFISTVGCFVLGGKQLYCYFFFSFRI